MAKVELNNIRLGHSSISDKIYAGTQKDGMWNNKKDVTNDFLYAVIQRWQNQVETITDQEGKVFQISVIELPTTP